MTGRTKLPLTRRAFGGLGLALAAPALALTPPRALRLGVVAPRGITTRDPHFATAHPDRMLATFVHCALVRFAPGSISPDRLEPDLAESWTASPDKTEWSFVLRRDAALHDGSGVLEAEDVVYSLIKAADRQRSATAGDYGVISSVEATGRFTVRLRTRAPAPNLIGLLANYAGGFILPRGRPETSGIGAGPFKIVGEEAGRQLSLAGHPGYFRGPPRIGAIDYVFLGSIATGDLAFQAGELDIVEGQQDQAWVDRMSARPGARVDVIAPAELALLHLNVTAPPLGDPQVRRAIALAVDRRALATWRGASIAREARGVIPADYVGFSDGGGLAAPDLDRAKALLAEAGHPNGITLRTVHTSNTGMLSAIQVVQSQLRRAGIALEIDVVDHATYHRMIRQDLSPVVHYAAARFPIADIMLTQFFHSRSIVGQPGAVTNFSHCDVADDVLDAARAEADPARQRALWAEAQRRILAADCAVPLIETRGVWARRDAVDYGFDFAGSMSTGPLITETTRLN